MKSVKLLLMIVLSAAVFVSCGNKDNDNQMQENGQNAEFNAQDQGGNTEDLNSPQGNVSSREQNQTIVAVTSRNSDLTTFLKAIQSVDDDQLLSNDGNYTVFAPTDSAFKAMSNDRITNLMLPESADSLRNVVACHVVEGNYTADDLTDGKVLTTMQGEQLMVSNENGKIMVDGAQVIEPDMKASNGIIHVINKVLVPKN